ncbi:phenylalanine--tRNA ligase subunit beta [uncultured Chitinophaga sp.]|uniref:phenylalanine--tRNA ligase subunit beta n=1 Tax=uncultured Chitinophaga sp. TaxID=339340 RepID=UPI0025D25631|nr:phenylalanine--tRNA ligase subunit beta [uncultured Chitinophaga sp.]
MTISYNWLCEYLPVKPAPEELSVILTAIGLEVESLEAFESIKGSLEGLVIGEVLEVEKHPNADKLRLTKVNIGTGEPLAIVCGAPNVAVGQKVVIAPIGATIYPLTGDPLTMKKAKIRGEESNGMICAEDEIGLGTGHDGILVLDAALVPGTPAREVFKPVQDFVFEIGLTPNRMDAMSHLGVARDVCAWLNNHHNTSEYTVRSPLAASASGFEQKLHEITETVASYRDAFELFNSHSGELPITVSVENSADCPRYSGVSITGVTVGESPDWLKQRLQAIGVRPINNIVDITNFVLHETGQPLHAFDAAQIKGNRVIVKNLPQDTLFTTLDDKERKLDARDLMICNGEGEGMCIAGVFGGATSGVTDSTTSIFLESAWFAPGTTRASSVRHGLRTDAATRFEKGVDIGNVVRVLERAAALICELGGGKIASDIIDVYPQPKEKTEVEFTYAYIHKLSGNAYPVDKIKNILLSLGFGIISETEAGARVSVPFSKPDISIPADIVEEIMRIDGLDNIIIPAEITIAPSVQPRPDKERIREKVAAYLAGNGFMEIFTNSITNSQYYDADTQAQLVKMLNNLSADLDTMRPSMLETGLESVAYNLNRKNENLLFFETGKTYKQIAVGQYEEKEHLCLYLTGDKLAENWMRKPEKVDFYFLKGFVINIFRQLGIQLTQIAEAPAAHLQPSLELKVKDKVIGVMGSVAPQRLKTFDIKQAVWFADIYWDEVLKLLRKADRFYTEIPKYPAVRRDLALVLDKSVKFAAVEEAAKGVKSSLLQGINLFDVFESEKLGAGKKSYAVSFTFQDPQKTLTDKDVDGVMNKLVKAFESQLQAEIRK